MEIENTEVSTSAEVTDAQTAETTQATETTQKESPAVSPMEALKAKAEALTDGPEPEKAKPIPVPSENKNIPVIPGAGAYVPNLKYKVKDTEKEFDPRLASLIKTKEDEEFVRQMVTRADALDDIKGSRDSIKTEKEEIATKYDALASDVYKVFDCKDKRDYKSVLDMIGVDTKDMNDVLTGLGYTRKDILEHALHLADLTPDQVAVYDQRRQHEIQAHQLQSTVLTAEQRAVKAESQLREHSLQTSLSQPDLAPLVEAFDKANGQGAFKAEVINRGALYWQARKIDAPPEQMINEVAAMVRPFMSTQQQQPQAVQQNQNMNPQPQAAPGVIPVIPNVGGNSSASPARMKIKDTNSMRAFGATLSD